MSPVANYERGATETSYLGHISLPIRPPQAAVRMGDERIYTHPKASDRARYMRAEIIHVKNRVPESSMNPAGRIGGNIIFKLWFNTYRYVAYTANVIVYFEGLLPIRKFFLVAVLLNLAGIFLAAIGKWQYPRQYTGAFVLGNLQAAILIRNELFVRFLYFIVNLLFAKVCS